MEYLLKDSMHSANTNIIDVDFQVMSSPQSKCLLLTEEEDVHSVGVIVEFSIIAFLVFLLVEFQHHVGLVPRFTEFDKIVDVPVTAEDRWVHKLTEFTLQILPEEYCAIVTATRMQSLPEPHLKASKMDVPVIMILFFFLTWPIPNTCTG
jgi:hypothetical protein